MEIDAEKCLAAAPDGTSAEDDFGDLLVSGMLYSADRLFDHIRLPHRYWLASRRPPTKNLRRFRHRKPTQARRALEKAS